MSAPAVLAAIPLLAGVISGCALSIDPRISLPFLAATWVGAVCCLWRGRPRSFLAFCTCAFVAAGAALSARAASDAFHPSLVEWFQRTGTSDAVRITGTFREDAAVTPFSVSAAIDVSRIETRDAVVIVEGGLRASIAGPLAISRAEAWRQGRTATFQALLREPLDYRNIGVSSDRDRLARQGIALFATIKSAALVENLTPGPFIAEAAAAFRAAVRRAVRDEVGCWSRASGGVVTAILIGDRSGLDPADERRMQAAGTYHVIAISGGNIALLMMMVVAAGRVFRLPRRATAASAIAILIFYGYAAGLASSVLRATSAGVLYLTARVLDHRSAPRAGTLNALAVAGAVAAIASPLSIQDAGFLLSFGATLGIIIAVERLAPRPPPERRVSARDRFIAGALHAIRALAAATICAELALAPISARLFGRVSLAGLVLNFAAIPLMAIIQVTGMAAVLLHALLPVAARGCGWFAYVGTAALLQSASLVDLCPWLVIDVPPPAAVPIVCWYAAWTAWLVSRKPFVRRAAVTVVLIVSVVIAWSPAVLRAERVPASPPGWVRVAFLDVGQGDATVVLPSSGLPLIVDAGGAPGSTFDVGRRVTLPATWALGISRVEALVLTHGDPDHIGGAQAVIDALSPRAVWEGIPVPRHLPMQQLRTIAARRGVAWKPARTGDVREFGSFSIRVLHPASPDWERQNVRNDDSIVLEVRAGDVAFVLPGDITQAVEPEVVSAFVPAPLTIVKAPHHGSAGSSSRAFIEATHPAAVVFSAGRRNPFGHPAAAAVERYRAAGARVFRTDEDGEIIADTDGRQVVIWTWSGRREVFSAPALADQLRRDRTSGPPSGE
jgi:competence protein ComEC